MRTVKLLAPVAGAVNSTENRYGFSSLSSLSISTLKLNAPAAVTVIAISNVVLPEAAIAVVAGGVTANVQLFSVFVAITGVPVRFRVARPRLSIVQVSAAFGPTVKLLPTLS